MSISGLGGKLVLMGAMVLTLASCGLDRRDFNRLSAEPSPAGRAIAGMRFLTACPTASPSAVTGILPATVTRAPVSPRERSAIVGALAPIVADTAVEFIGLQLDRARTRLNGIFLATGVHVRGPERLRAAGQTVSRDDGCVVIFHGSSGVELDDDIGSGLPHGVLSSLGLSGQPAFYLELASETQNGTRVLRMHHLQYAATSAMRRGSGRKTVTVAIGFGASGKNAEEPTEAAEVYLFNLGQLEVGNSYPGLPSQAAVAKLAATGTFNMVARVTESEEPSIALEALTKSFATNKKGLSEALQEALK